MDTQSSPPQAQSQDQSFQPPQNSGTAASGQPLALQQQEAISQAPSDASDSADTGISEQDRQYIDKAIAVVEDNAKDPYEQSRAIKQIRTDYLREKFGKQLNGET